MNNSLDGIIPFAMLKKNKGSNNGCNFDDLTDDQKEQLKGEKGEKGDKGDKGDNGKSSYQIWLENGNVGSEDDFLNSLKGEKGDKGDDGGITPEMLETLQTKSDDNLNTKNKNVVDAINEINNQLNNIDQVNLQAGEGINIDNNIINLKVDDKTIEINDDGQLQAKLFVDGCENDDGSSGIRQYIFKDIKNGTKYNIDDAGLPINHKVMTSILAIKENENVEEIITNFDLNITDIFSDNGIKIQDTYILKVNNNETPIINKSDFIKIFQLEI